MIMGNKYEELKKADKIAAIITDLDNTLWKGTLAEKQELTLNKEYYQYLQDLYQKGIQIIVVSKNDEAEVIDAFKKLKIKYGLFTLVIANWDAKYLNIERLLQQTSLRPETVIFVDDNSLERAEVKAKLSKIHCLDSADWAILVNHHFLKGKEKQPESEISERINRYRTAIRASSLKEKFKGEDEDFLRSLKRELSIGEIKPDNLDRFTRLLVVTHRINFNPGKFEDYNKALDYLHKEINEGYKLFAVSTKENGIALGLTGALVVKVEKGKAVVEDATFSCGIIGRDFEQKSILEFTRIMKEEGVREVEFYVLSTSTNKRVKEIFEEIGANVKLKEGEKVVYSIDTKTFKPKKNYDWIKVSNKNPDMDYNGIPSIIDFFSNYAKPLIKNSSNVVNLGAAKGEVLGHLKKEMREDFYKFITEKNINYTKVDIENVPNEGNVIGNAENLHAIIKDESQDLVLAIELLEHTEHFWKVINEMIRICKVGGYILITVPSFNYPKHEYPIDLWRIGPVTLESFFPSDNFKVVKKEIEGDKKSPRRTMLLVRKLKSYSKNYDIPKNGQTDWKTGLTIFH